jgi:hypothetical protein
MKNVELGNFPSLEILWLCLYMFKKHKKAWDGEQWKSQE